MKLRFNLEVFKSLVEEKKHKGVTLRTVAKKYAEIKGISEEAAYQFLHAIYRGRRTPPTDLQTISAIAEALNVSPEVLLKIENKYSYRLSQEAQAYAPCIKKVIYYIKETYTGLITDSELEKNAVSKEEVFVKSSEEDKTLIGIIVESDYMCPRIYPRDRLVFSLDEKVSKGDIVLVHPQGDKIHIGVLKEFSKRKVVIEPWDPRRYKEKEFRRSDIMNMGKIVELKFS
ncbi:S24 family peptidase [Aquifex sp.]